MSHVRDDGAAAVVKWYLEGRANKSLLTAWM